MKFLSPVDDSTWTERLRSTTARCWKCGYRPSRCPPCVVWRRNQHAHWWRSTRGSSQISGSSSRLKELHDRLQLGTRHYSTRVERPPTWRDQPVRSVVIASYKMNIDGRYPRHNRMDWTTAQRARRDCFHEASWAEYYAQPRIPEGAVDLIIEDSLIRVLTRIQSHWQTGVLSFFGAATPQILASLEMLDRVKIYTVTLMMGTNAVSRGKSRKAMRLHEKMSCILEELRIQKDFSILTICWRYFARGIRNFALWLVISSNIGSRADPKDDCPRWLLSWDDFRGESGMTITSVDEFVVVCMSVGFPPVNFPLVVFFWNWLWLTSEEAVISSFRLKYVNFPKWQCGSKNHELPF